MNIPLNIDWQQIILHLLNFAILAGGLYFLLYHPVRKFMDQREEHYRQMETEAQQRLDQAKATEEEYRQQLKQAYVPDIAGKERRKRHPGKEGKLGVEGMRPEVLLEALRRCGATLEGEDAPAPGGDLTKADMMDKGLVGPNSAARRQQVLRDLGLPEHLTANGLLEALNLLLTREEFEKL